jgi:hypothetical protein
MSDERLTELNKTSSAPADSVNTTKEWQDAVDDLNAKMLEETPALIQKIYNHFLDLGYRDREIAEMAEASGEEKKLRSFARRELKASFRKDIAVGRKLVEWQEALDRPKTLEQDLGKIFSEVGLGVGFGLLGKLPDTYTKPNLQATDTEKRRNVAIAIFDDLVSQVQQGDETSPKNDIKLADIGHLIKLNCLPETGSRVEYDKTTRGEVVEVVSGEDGNPDGVIVRIDGSGEEALITRGTKKLKEEKPAQLHEAAIVRGDDPKLHGQTVVVKNWESGTEGNAEVLRLDGTLEIVPSKDLVKAPSKKSRIVGDLLNLVSEGGALAKIEIAVEQAKQPLLKEIDKLNEALVTSHEEGQVYAVSSLREQGKLGDFRPEIFNELPIAQRIEVIKAMPEPEQQEILVHIASSAVQPTAVQPKLAPLTEELVAEESAILIEAGEATIKFEPTIETVVADRSDCPNEIQAEPVLDFKPENTADGAVPEQAIAAEASEITVEQNAVAAERAIETQIEELVEEPELDKDLVEKAEKLLLLAFNEYRESIDVNPKRGGAGHIIFANLIKSEPTVKKFLAHNSGCYFLTAIATDPWGAVLSDINSWGVADPEIVRNRVNAVAETELFHAIDLFKAGNKTALEPLDKRLKIAACATLSKKEKALAKQKAAQLPESVSVHPVVKAKADIDQIRGWLLSTVEGDLETAIGTMQGFQLALEDIVSPDDLREFHDSSIAKSKHVNRILKHFDKEDYIASPIW